LWSVIAPDRRRDETMASNRLVATTAADAGVTTTPAATYAGADAFTDSQAYSFGDTFTLSDFVTIAALGY
jgi:hypothetical protein